MFGLIFRGMAVGMTETVPGISGSTVAMILGIYERLIYSLSILTTKNRKEAFPFLFAFGVGMVVGFAISIFIIDYLLSTFRTPTLLFFVGIIVGFLPYLWKETLNHCKNKLSIKHYLIMLLFLGVVIVGQFLGGMIKFDVTNLSITDYIFFAIAGFVASIALVLPGISGALILTILGLYEIATASLISFNFPIILAIGSGIVLGVLLTSKLIRYLLSNYTAETYAAMIGLVSGSIFAILNNLDSIVNISTIVASALTFLIGIAFIIILNKTKNRF
jgi:putative membrane protein